MSSIAAAQLGLQPGTQTDTVTWRTVQSGTFSKIDKQLLRVFDSDGEFKTYWAQAMGQPAAAAPSNINWLTERVVAVHAGQRKTGGYSVRVAGIEKRGVYNVVRAVENLPTPGAFVTDAISSPWVIVAVKRDAGMFQLAMSQVEGGRLPGGMNVTMLPPNFPPYGYGQGDIWFDPRAACAHTVFHSGDVSLVVQPGILQATSTLQWRQTWTRVTGQSPDSAPGGIDWTREKVVVVNVGQRRTGGYGLKVMGVERRGAIGVVHILEETPSPNSFVTQQLTSPFVVVRVPRELETIRMEVRARTRPDR